jgi:chromate transporter
VPSTLDLLRTFFVIGLTAFGMAVMQAIRTTPVRRGWLAREEIDEGFGLVQLYPGAIMVDLVAYIGYRLRGIRGAVAAAFAFVLPSLLMLLVFSWAFFSYGSHPAVRDLAIGLEALVVGVLVHVTLDFGSQHAQTRLTAVVALGAFAIEIAGQNVLWAVLAAVVLGAVWRGAQGVRSAALAPLPPFSARRLLLALVPGVVVGAGALVAVLSPGALAAVTADMAQIGSVAFGNGTAIMPLIEQAAISHHWLTLRQFGVGIGLGQVTPGPFLATAAFVGYGAAGWWGGVSAGLAIYAPSVAMTVVFAEIYPFLRRLRWVPGAIRGVMASFTGLLASVVLLLGRPVLPVPAAIGLAAAAFVAVRVLKWSIFLVFVSGLAVWAVYLLLGGPL